MIQCIAALLRPFNKNFQIGTDALLANEFTKRKRAERGILLVGFPFRSFNDPFVVHVTSCSATSGRQCIQSDRSNT
jgi:hypothetical protein